MYDARLNLSKQVADEAKSISVAGVRHYDPRNVRLARAALGPILLYDVQSWVRRVLASRRSCPSVEHGRALPRPSAVNRCECRMTETIAGRRRLGGARSLLGPTREEAEREGVSSSWRSPTSANPISRADLDPASQSSSVHPQGRLLQPVYARRTRCTAASS